MQRPGCKDFDFDGWARLAESDPEGFEKRRREAIEELISSAPDHSQRRLRGLQWQIDMVRARCKNPLESCIKLNDMLWDFVYAENGFLDAVNKLASVFHGTGDPERARGHGQVPQAKVIPLSKKRAAR